MDLTAADLGEHLLDLVGEVFQRVVEEQMQGRGIPHRHYQVARKARPVLQGPCVLGRDAQCTANDCRTQHHQHVIG